MANARVAVIGAGLGGLCAAVKLKEAGFDFTILEQAQAVGGTWRENTYPGCACDTPISVYQFSFFPSVSWGHLFPRAAEVKQYAEEMVAAYQLGPHLKLGQGVAAARWDAGRKLWRLQTTTGETIEAEAVISGLGQLNRPQWPDIPGRETFAGAHWHSAQWNHGVSLAGKRVAVIGSAASAVQLIPEVAKVAGQLDVYQRSPNWLLPRNDREITREEVALMLTEPESAMHIGQLARDSIYLNADHFFWQAFSYSPEGRAAFQKQAQMHLDAQVADPELRKKLTPDYPIGCKRILFCDDYYPTLQRPNVGLITDAISAITTTGVTTKDGAARGYDVIVYATGFETTGWHWSMAVEGEGGHTLGADWKDGPEAYLGIMAKNFPNFFMLYGPNTNLGHNTITFMIERQVEFAVKALQHLASAGARAIAVTPAAQARFNAELQARLSKTTWADPHCVSWYKTADGRITQNWGSHTRDYAAQTKELQLADMAVA